MTAGICSARLFSDPNILHEPEPGVLQVELDMLFKEEDYLAMLEA